MKGTPEFVPVHYMHRSVDPEELAALYAVSEVCLISSTRDGMNLVSFEYIACQEQLRGSLILSEFTGAAEHLRGAAMVCNPWDTEELAKAIHDAVSMSEELRQANYEKMSKVVNKWTRYV